MAKYYGVIGYGVQVETRPGIWENQVVEREYFGDLLKNYKSTEQRTEVNDNIEIANRISIVADPYANENFHAMLYVTFMGTKWKIKSIEVEYPRLILSIGGVYNDGPNQDS